jgi:hypothetical protein
MKKFEYGDLVQTTLGNGNFVEYSNGKQSYKIAFVDGPHAGLELSVGERGIVTQGRKKGGPKQIESKYAPYIGNEDAFDAPVDLTSPAIAELMKQMSKWFLIISASPDSIEGAVAELSKAGLGTPEDYIRISGAATHGVKYDLFVPDPEMAGVDLEVGMYFNPIRLSSTGCYQIGRKEFALHVLPHVRVLEIGEELPKAE